MFKVLLLNPPVLSVVEPWYDAPAFGRLALASLASYLRQSPHFEIKIIDAKFERLDFKQVLERAAAWRPDVVGLTAFTNEVKPAAYQAALIKRALPATTTVIGGVHATALPEQTLREFPSFDIAVVGEGEITFHELCEALRLGNSLGGIPGLALRTPGGTIVTAARERILDHDSIPLPAWDMLPPAQEYWVQSLRGCPFDCVFCMNPNGRVARKRSVASVMAELRLIDETYHPSLIRFGDEIFSVDMPRTRELVAAMTRQGIGTRTGWVVQTHVRYVDEALFAQMKKAGVTRVEMGVETGMEEALKTMGKGTNTDMIEEAFRSARGAGVTTGAFFLFGQPNETEATMMRTTEFAVKLNPDLPMFGVMTPYPGTEVARLAAKGEAGYRLLSTDWDEYNKQIGGALEFAGLSRTRIECLQLLAYGKVFLCNLRFADFLRCVWDYRVGVWSVLVKILFWRKSLAGLARRPHDYVEVINSLVPSSVDDILAAREAWVQTQKAELIRTRKLGHPASRGIDIPSS